MARYADAIQWIVDNDDTDWVEEYENGSHPSVSACLVADLFDKTQDQVAADILKGLQKHYREKYARE